MSDGCISSISISLFLIRLILGEIKIKIWNNMKMMKTVWFRLYGGIKTENVIEKR